MKATDKEKAILLVLLGIGICVLSYLVIIKPNWDERQTLESQAQQLQGRLNELLAKEADRPMYEAGIIEYTEKLQKVLDAFPSDLNQEITIMFMDGVKKSNDFAIESLGLGEKALFYTLGSSAAADGTLNTADQSGEAANEGTTEAAGTANLAEGGLGVGDGSLMCYAAEFPISYTGSYKALKDVVAYVDNYSDRMTVDSMTISYAGDNQYIGDLQVTCYSVEGEDRPERSIELNEIEIGVDNIFEGGSGANSNSSSLNKYDDKDGVAIETDYDFYTMLNAASSDVSAKVVGQNGTGKEGTVISNSDNTVSAITYDFYEVDGKNYCKYTLDGNQYYEAEITSAEDVKLLIQSSGRKNDEDKAGANITINNTTSLPVYVKVSGDDSVSPRVTVTKAGLVKVYQ